jgi:hypothetical protein
MKHGHYENYSNECDECQQEAKKIRDLFSMLEIPVVNSIGMKKGTLSARVTVRGQALYDILTDEEKLKILVSKLRNKAFW